jgi:hypothetical protein
MNCLRTRSTQSQGSGKSLSTTRNLYSKEFGASLDQDSETATMAMARNDPLWPFLLPHEEASFCLFAFDSRQEEIDAVVTLQFIFNLPVGGTFLVVTTTTTK